MLQKQAVPNALLAVLEEVSPLFNKYLFYLAGGTSLALRLGHRLSVDLDFFTDSPFSVEQLEQDLRDKVETMQTISKTKGSLCVVINGVKVEAFHYPTLMLRPTEFIDQVTYSSLEDNAAMKLSALVNRGSKKDFCDIAALLDHIPLRQLLALYEQKYSDSNLFMVMTSLTYFDDAEMDSDPEFLNGHDWDMVKDIISQHVKNA